MNLSNPKRTDSYVYTLIHTETNKVFYVGRAVINHGYFRRFSEHIMNAKHGSHYEVHRKMRALWQEGQHVRWEIVSDGLTFEQSLAMERKLIASYGRDQLCNGTSGGQGRASPLVGNASFAEVQHRMSPHSKEVWAKKEDTGEVFKFKSTNFASQCLQVQHSHIRYSIENNRVARGYRFSREPFVENAIAN